jgi:hypothetical protein
MISRCERCGQNYPDSAGHICSGQGTVPANENQNKVLIWRRGYMREYMRKRRERLKGAP